MKILIDTEKGTIKIDNNKPICYIKPTETLEKVEPIQDTNKEYKLSNLSLQRLIGVHPKLVSVIKKAIINSPYDFSIVSGARTTQEQQELYKQGRTVKGKIITNCDGVIKKSNHQTKSDNYGYAIDFGIFDRTVPGNIDWNAKEKYKAVAEHIKNIAVQEKVKIVWGGDWQTFKDYPHIELVGLL